MQIEFLAGDELISIVPNFSLATEGSTLACLLVRRHASSWLSRVVHQACSCRQALLLSSRYLCGHTSC